jgi:hypothetical protein
MSSLSKAQVETDGYMLAASVLDSFDPAAIQPFLLDESQSLDYDELLAKAVLTQVGPTAFEWRLSDEARKASLRILAKHDKLQQALAMNPGRRKNTYQKVFEQYIHGEAPSLDVQSLEQLQASLQAVRLLSDVVPEMPDESAVTALVRKQTFLQQFRVLADEHFFGRSNELLQLNEFVDALPVSGYSRLRRAVISFASDQLGMDSFVKTPPLMIQGPGGIGKSSLLAKFLIEHADRGVQNNLVFAYIDFDRSAIWPDEPLTVLADIAGQFASQASSNGADLLQLQQDINEELSRSEDYSVEYDSSESLGRASVAENRQLRYLQRFISLSKIVFPHGKKTTMLLVFDSFEEVTQRGKSHVLTLFRFLNDLQLAAPRLRIVLSGRGALRVQVGHKKLELRPVDPKTALAILDSYEITDQEILKCIIARVGGHPLSIRLAAQLVAIAKREAALNPDGAHWDQLFSSKLNARLDEGILFRRIVDHIDDPEVRKLINPGFVLRVLTPDLILYVLKDACNLAITSSDEAKDLFAKLAAYNSLVSQRSQWKLKHRSDVRGMILDALRRTQPDLCKQIWKAGVIYYEDKLRVSDRAEEMYCRLMLSEPPDELNRRWRPGIEKLLINSHDEMPKASADFLQYKLISGGTALADAAHFPADALAMRQAEEMKYLLSRGDARAALAVPDSPLQVGDDPLHPHYALTARVYAQMGEFDVAFQMAYSGLELLDRGFHTETSNYLDLLLLAAQMCLEWHRSGRDASMRSFASEAMSADQLWRWFRAVPRGRATRYRRLRVAVYVLDLIKLDINQSHPAVGLGKLEMQCVATVLHLIRKINSFEDEINGLFILRMFALLAFDLPARTELRTLLALEPVRRALVDGFVEQIGKGIQQVAAQLDISGSRASDLFRYVTGQESTSMLRTTLESGEYSDADFQIVAQAIAFEFALRDSNRRAASTVF